MYDPVTAAKTARELLSRALAALQSDPAVPPHLLAIAEPISQAMSGLFQIERSAGASVGSSGPAALDAVRRSLALLQQQEIQHPAVGVALESVAKSLSLIHGLATAQPPQSQPAAPIPQASPAPPTPRSPGAQPAPAPPAYGAQPAPAPPAYGAQPAPAPPAYGAQPAPPAYGAQVSAPYPPRVAQDPFPAAVQVMPTALQPTSQATPAAQSGQQPPVGLVDPSRAIRIDAALGAHSNSNFYKGLSGNDVIEHGGIFVATYRVPSVGSQVALRIALPGGYEFDALGIVRWVREPSSGEEPGFGAQLLQLSPEARQLVYRYVRNREPLFHDDA